MPLHPAFALLWCLLTPALALAYGEYTSVRQASGRALTLKERARNFCLLYAATIGFLIVPWVAWTSLPLRFVFVQVRELAAYALAPLALYYCFDLPLRLVRHLSNRAKGRAAVAHPLDGAWPDRSSALDQLALLRAKAPGQPPSRVDEAHPSPDSAG